MVDDDKSSSSSSDSSDDERKNESFDDKMKRITQLGKSGNTEELLKEAQLTNCTEGMVQFAAKKSKDMGNDAFARREYEQALEHYAGALVGDIPEKYKIYSNRSACLFQLGKYTEALVEATHAIKMNRSWSKGYYRAGRAALEMEFYDEAHEMLQKGLEKDPENKDLCEWAEKAQTVRNQQQQNKLLKKHTTDYSKFDDLTKQQKDEEDEEEMEHDPTAVVFGDRYYSSSKMEQKQLKSMLGYKEPPPPPFEPSFDTDLIYRHDARGAKTQHPIWDPSRREWRLNATPAPSRVDYSDSQQAQAIALFLERQTEVAHVEELLASLDERAAPSTAYCNAVRDIISQLMGSDGKASSGGVAPDNARWLFMGLGNALPFLTASRYLPTAELVAVSAARGIHITDLSLQIMKDNGVKKDQFKFIHRPSHEVHIVDPDGEDINNMTGRVDIVTMDYSLFDPGLLGKGVLAKINHVKKKLATSSHLFMPMGATVLCCPIQMISPRGDGPDGLDWRAVDDARWGAFYETANLDEEGIREPWTPLGKVHEVFDFDFTENEMKLSGCADIVFTAQQDGILNCIAFWYKLALTENVELDHTPMDCRPAGSPRVCHGDYMRHATQWLAAPVDVSKGDEVHIRASYSRSRVRFEVTSPDLPKKERKYGLPRWLNIRWQDDDRLEAYRKAISKALEKIMDGWKSVPELDRPPLRLIHMGAGIGQLSMVAAKCCRDAGIDDEYIDTYGSTVCSFESMPKVGKLAKQAFKDNDLDRDIFWCSEDVRKIPNQPQRAQLLVSELIDPGLLGEGILVFNPPARVKMCNAFEHQVIPSRGTIWCAAFELGGHLKNYEGFDMSAFNCYRIQHMVDIDTMIQKGTARQMSVAFNPLTFDFENNIYPPRKSVNIKPLENGTINSIVFWYEVAMDPEGEIILTNWPESIPPADFAMLEKDLHRPKPLRQAIYNFEGEYCKEVTKGEEVELDIGYMEAWPQFTWPGTEMVPTEDGKKHVPKTPPQARHKMYYDKMKKDTGDMEQKLQHGLMFDEEMLGDGYAAAERVALEPNGNPNYTIDPNNAHYFHYMFFL